MLQRRLPPAAGHRGHLCQPHRGKKKTKTKPPKKKHFASPTPRDSAPIARVGWGKQGPAAPRPGSGRSLVVWGHAGPPPHLGASLTHAPPPLQVHVYDPYDDDYYQTVPIDSHQTAYISSGHYGHQYGGGWPRLVGRVPVRPLPPPALPGPPDFGVGVGGAELGWGHGPRPSPHDHFAFWGFTPGFGRWAG